MGSHKPTNSASGWLCCACSCQSFCLLSLLPLIITSIQRCTPPRRRRQWGRRFGSWPTWTSLSMAGSDQDLASVPPMRMPNGCLPTWTRASLVKSDRDLANVPPMKMPNKCLPTWTRASLVKSERGLESEVQKTIQHIWKFVHTHIAEQSFIEKFCLISTYFL